jgi:hypothetical protein
MCSLTVFSARNLRDVLMSVNPGYDGDQFLLQRVTVRHVRNEDGTVSTTVEGAGPWYCFQEERTDFSGKTTIQLGGVILGTEQQTVSRIHVEHLNGFSALVVVPFIDENGHPSSFSGRAVQRADLERIATTIDHGIGLVLDLYDEFKIELIQRLGVNPPSDDDLYGWCCLVLNARESGVMDQIFDHFLGRATAH